MAAALVRRRGLLTKELACPSQGRWNTSEGGAVAPASPASEMFFPEAAVGIVLFMKRYMKGSETASTNWNTALPASVAGENPRAKTNSATYAIVAHRCAIAT